MSARSFMTPEEVAETLAVTPRTVTNLIQSGELPAVRVGKQWRVDPVHFYKFLEHGGTPTYREYVELIARERKADFDYNPK